MSSLYPSTLFHFTEKQSLFKILKDTFKVSYAREEITGPTHNRKFAVPMVSFCDIRLAEIKHFIDKKYGNYGIGLTKEWANRNDLNPVMYMSKHSKITDNFIEGLDGVFNHLKHLADIAEINTMTDNYHNIMNVYRYMKNY